MNNTMVLVPEVFKRRANICLAATLIVSGFFVFAGTASAARNITGATLNGASSVTVKGSTSITAAVTVQTTSPSNPWGSTRYRFGTGSWACADVPDHPAGTTATETFLITSPSGSGTYNVTFEAYAGDTCSSGTPGTLTLSNGVIVDNTPPVLNLPADIIQEATGSSGAVVTFTATATDANPTNPIVTCVPASGLTFPIGLTTVNCSTTDTAGNTATGNFKITVRDTTPPVIAAHGNVSIAADSLGGATVSYTAPATIDNVDPAGIATCDPASGSVFPIGITTVTCNAQDAAGNNAIPTTFTVTVTPGPVSPTMSTVTTTSGNVTTDGGVLAQITVTVKDQYGNLIIGLAASKVVLSASGTGNTLNQPSLPTNIDGQAFGAIASSKAETKTIAAIVDGVPLSAPAYITFVPGAFHHINVTPAGPQSVEYGNTIAFSAQGYDENNNPISGLSYAWSVVPGTGAGTVDNNGLFIATGVGTFVVRATSGAISGDSGTITIDPRPITVTADAKTKIYGQPDPELTYQITSGSLAFSDNFTGEISREAEEDVGTYTIGQGTLALTVNYDLTFVEADFEITPATLTISATADNKVYDGTTDATAHLEISGLIDGDAITADYGDAVFDNKNVGTGKTVTVTGITIDGAKSDNYTFNDTATATADITARPITVTAETDTKVYDSNNSSDGTPTITEGELAADDIVVWSQTFDSKNVGVNKALTPSGTVNDGNGGNNYNVTFMPDNTGVITQKDLTVTATGVNKVYDGTVNADAILTTDALPGDDVTASGTASFDTKDVGSGKTVSVINISISGADAGNYNLTNTTASTTADITERPITVTADAKSKIYGETDPELTYQITSGSLVDDDAFSGALNRDPGDTVGVYAINQNDLALSSNYDLTYVGADFTIEKATPVIAWNNPDDITYPTPLSDTQLNATADVPGTFDYTPNSGTVLPAGSDQELSATFTPTDTVNYESKTTTVNINVLKGTPVITWPNPADVVAGTFLDGTQLNATADVAGTFTYTPSIDTQLTDAGTQPLSVNFVPNDVSYNSVDTSVNINVYPAPIFKLTVSVDNQNPTTAQTVTLTVNGRDQYNNITTNQSGTIVVVSADNGGSLGSGLLTLTNNGEATTTLNKTSAGVVNVTVSSGILIPGSVVVTFTPADTTGPNIIIVNPSGAGVSISAPLFFTTNEPLKSTTVNSTNVQLWKAGNPGVADDPGTPDIDETVPPVPDEQVPAVVSLVEGGERVNIAPDSSLEYSTSYYFVITSGVTDEAGNALTNPKDSSNTGFTTAENTADVVAPTITAHSPADTTGVSVSIAPSITFSESLKSSTVNSASVGFTLADGTPVAATVSLVDAGTRIVITPAAMLAYSTDYKITVSTDINDEAGNPLATPTEYDFTTEGKPAEPPVNLAVTGISAVANSNGSIGFAIADNTYENGWAWTFNVTVPTSETELQMKFVDWTSSLPNTIPVANNIRYSSSQASNGPVEITAANTYGDVLQLTGDFKPDEPGRQIQILVEARIPAESAGGSYSTSYGIQTN